MTLSVRQYTPETASQMPANANAIHKRLMNPPQRKADPEAVVVLRIVEDAPEWPLWQREVIRFDDHITAWQMHLANALTPNYIVYIKRRCIELGMSYDDLRADKYAKKCPSAQHLIQWELRTKFNLPFMRIGLLFDREYTTIVKNVKRMTAYLSESPSKPHTTALRIAAEMNLRASVRAAVEEGGTFSSIGHRHGITEKAVRWMALKNGWKRP